MGELTIDEFSGQLTRLEKGRNNKNKNRVDEIMSRTEKLDIDEREWRHLNELEEIANRRKLTTEF